MLWLLLRVELAVRHGSSVDLLAEHAFSLGHLQHSSKEVADLKRLPLPVLGLNYKQSLPWLTDKIETT